MIAELPNVLSLRGSADLAPGRFPGEKAPPPPSMHYRREFIRAKNIFARKRSHFVDAHIDDKRHTKTNTCASPMTIAWRLFCPAEPPAQCSFPAELCGVVHLVGQEYFCCWQSQPAAGKKNQLHVSHKTCANTWLPSWPRERESWNRSIRSARIGPPITT